LFFPGRQYTNEEMVTALRGRQIDAILFIEPGDAGSTSGYVPPSYSTRCTVWTSSGGCTQAQTSTTGGYSYNRPWQQYTARVFEAGSGNVMWTATASTGGNAYARVGTLVHSMSNKTFDRLLEDVVIR